MTKTYLSVATSLAKQAGEIMRKNFTLNMEKEWKGDRAPVTVTDTTINDIVLTTIKKEFPSHSILSEEGDDFSPESEFVWICDPVDGTHNFSHGIPTATFALALTHNGQPLVSVIYDPFLDRLFSAEKGKGAFLNNHPIRVSNNPMLKNTVMGMGKMKDVRNLFPVMEFIRSHGVIVMSSLSTHYVSALLAAGEFSAVFFGGTSPHDMTASALLVEEAGGKVTNIWGEKTDRYDRDMEGQLMTNGLVHDEIVAFMDTYSPRV
jgi:myo-inositol-1(or 4)-monophosphatase